MIRISHAPHERKLSDHADYRGVRLMSPATNMGLSGPAHPLANLDVERRDWLGKADLKIFMVW